MKIKIYIFFLFFFSSKVVQAQQASLVIAYNMMQKGDLDNALKVVESAVQNPETANSAKAWYYKGWILKEQFKKKGGIDPDFSLRRNAVAAFHKSIGFDTKAEFKKDCTKLIHFVCTSLYNEGTDAFNEKKYKSAIVMFEEYVADLSILSPDSVDHSSYFFLGYSCHHEKQEAKAKKYLEKCLALKYEDAIVYDFLAHIYEKEGKDAEAIKTIETGAVKFPNDKAIAISYVNMLMKRQKNKEAIPRIEKAIKLDPKSIDLYLVMGTACERMSVADPVKKADYLDKAKEAYTKVLSLDSNVFMANYNLGIILYNGAVEKINDQSYDIDILALDDVLNQTTVLFKKALPYLERSLRLKPASKNTLIALEGIYVHVNAEEKLAQVREKLAKQQQ
jgi:tetratricopeptide (TPR) repeat protein